MVAAKLRTFLCTPNKTLLALPSVAGTLTRGLAHFVRILAHVRAPQSLALGTGMNMHNISVILSILVFCVAFPISFVCLFRGIYYLLLASKNQKDGASENRFIKFNFLNSLVIQGALTESGNQHKKKGIKNLSVFICLSLLVFGMFSLSSSGNVT